MYTDCHKCCGYHVLVASPNARPLLVLRSVCTDQRCRLIGFDSNTPMVATLMTRNSNVNRDIIMMMIEAARPGPGALQFEAGSPSAPTRTARQASNPRRRVRGEQFDCFDSVQVVHTVTQCVDPDQAHVISHRAGTCRKAHRQARFPVGLLEAAFRIHVEQGQASVETRTDRRHTVLAGAG